MQKIIFRYKNELFLFASFWRGSSDGSFYWLFERNGKNKTYYQYNPDGSILEIQREKEEKKKTGISYHTTGCIHYKTTESKFIFAESLLDIKQNFCFAIYAIPSINKLDRCSKKDAKNNIIIDFGIDEIFDYRTTYSLIIIPYTSNVGGLLKIDYASEGFSIILNIENFSFENSNRIANSFVFMVPEGLFQNQQSFIPARDFIRNDKSYNEKWALIKYHQKINSTTDVIIYDQDNEHRYRIVFSVPARIPPSVEIIFSNLEYTIKLEQHKDTYLLFQVLNKDGNVIKDSTLVQITKLILSAEL